MAPIKNTVEIVRDGEVATVVAQPGTVLFSKRMVPDGIDRWAEVEETTTEDGLLQSKKLTFKVATLLTVEGLSPNRKTCFHVRFAREAREVALAEPGSQVNKTWPRLRRALVESGRESFHAQGGLYHARSYKDEIVVPDFSTEGSHGWIIRRSEVSDLLKSNPLTAEQIADLKVKLETAEAELAHMLSELAVVKHAGHKLHTAENFWDGEQILWQACGIGKYWWTKIIVRWADGTTHSWGFNKRTEVPKEEGDMVHYVPGWHRNAHYKSIPVGAVDTDANDGNSFLRLFDVAEKAEALRDFVSVTAEWFDMDGNSIKSYTTSRAEVVADLETQSYLKDLRTFVGKLRRTLRREGALS